MSIPSIFVWELEALMTVIRDLKRSPRTSERERRLQERGFRTIERILRICKEGEWKREPVQVEQREPHKQRLWELYELFIQLSTGSVYGLAHEAHKKKCPLCKGIIKIVVSVSKLLRTNYSNWKMLMNHSV